LVVRYDGSRILNLDLDFLNRLWVRTGERHLWHWVVWASEPGSAKRYMSLRYLGHCTLYHDLNFSP